MSSVTVAEPRRKPTQRRSQQTVDAILAATARVLVEGGYDEASTNRIAQVAGVSVGSLYQYFPNKQALVLALMRQHSDEMLALLREHAMGAMVQGVRLDEVVRTYVRAMIEAHAVDPELHRVLVPQVIALGVEYMDSFQRPVLELVRAFLEMHRAAIRPQDLDTAAFVLVAAVEGATHGAFLGVSDAPDAEALEREVSDLVLRYLLPDAR